jgi:hypothetical protein
LYLHLDDPRDFGRPRWDRINGRLELHLTIDGHGGSDTHLVLVPHALQALIGLLQASAEGLDDGWGAGKR